MKVKTAELQGAALDFVLAKIAGLPIRKDPMGPDNGVWYWVWDSENYPPKVPYQRIGGKADGGYSPSTKWHQGGPIIEREAIWLGPSAYMAPSVPPPAGREWWAKCLALAPLTPTAGPTPLIAAMRCYVASQMGDEVDVPKELA